MKCKYCESEMVYNEELQRFGCKKCDAKYYDYQKLKENDEIMTFLLNINYHKTLGEWHRGNF